MTSRTSTPIDQSSETMWWMLKSRTWRAGPSRSEDSRTSGPVARSNGVPGIADRFVARRCFGIRCR